MPEQNYKVSAGTSYHLATPQGVINALDKARYEGFRVRLWLGEGGKVWPEEYDVCGRIGRSMGPVRIPLLLHNRRSMGGGAILDHCIIRMVRCDTRAVLYEAPGFVMPAYEIVDRLDCYEVLYDGDVVARFSSGAAAGRWVAFMVGERMGR